MGKVEMIKILLIVFIFSLVGCSSQKKKEQPTYKEHLEYLDRLDKIR